MAGNLPNEKQRNETHTCTTEVDLSMNVLY